MSVIIVFEEPKEKEYHYKMLDQKFICAPQKRGEGCYGDCFDCFARDKDKYNRLKEVVNGKESS